MLTNYLKTAWRNLVKNKISSFINIGGLAAGMAVAMLIGLWVYDELSFNKYHQNYDTIGHVMVHNGYDVHGTYTSLPLPLAKELRSSFSDEFKHIVLSSGTGQHIISSGDKKFTQPGNYMQADAAEMLSLKMVYGTRKGLSDPGSILLTASLANKLFGNEDPVNKIIKLNNRESLRVSGVYEDIPDNSTFKDVSFIAPWDLFAANDWVKESENDWQNNSYKIYVTLSPGTSFESASAKIKDIELKHIDERRQALKPEVFVHPMSKWHLYSNFENRAIATSEQMKFVWFYTAIGIFVLLLACINFMNLSTARSEKRAKEVGIRKAVGSARIQLISQFFCESLLTAMIAFILSILFVWQTLPWFNGVAGKDIHLPWQYPSFWMTGIIFTLITGLLAGSYPALYLSSFRPVKVLKGVFNTGRFAGAPRKVLVVFQFTVSVMLIIGTIIVFRQIEFVRNRPVGYSQGGLVQIRMTSDDFRGKYEVLMHELRSIGAVSEMAESSSPVTGSWSNTGRVTWKDKDPEFEDDFALVRVSQEYGKTVGFKFIDGRDFSKQYASDSSGFIINETAAKYMGLKDPVGENLKWEFTENGNENFKIIGIVKDMVMNSPFEPVKQTLFVLGRQPNWIILKINPNSSVSEALPKIESVFKKIIPSAPFNYSFVSDDFAAKFAAEERIGKLATFFAALAILISCLGLFGLASFVAEQRTKEIGIRKVLGASVVNLWQMLSRDFVVLVIVSCLIAVPLAGYFMNEWLQQYQYRTEISWWIFAASGAGALMVTLLTVSFQAIKAALMNPVESLRSE